MSKLIQMTDSNENIYPLTKTFELLWTNPNPTDQFSIQTITISNLSDYLFILIDCWAFVSLRQRFTKLFKNELDNCSIVGECRDVSLNVPHRDFTIGNNSIAFFNGYYLHQQDMTYSLYDGSCIPLAIYGIR